MEVDLKLTGTIDASAEEVAALVAALQAALPGLDLSGLSTLGPDLVTDGGMDGDGSGSIQDNEWESMHGALLDGALAFSIADGETLAQQVLAGRPHPAGTYRVEWDQSLASGTVKALLDGTASAAQSASGPASVDLVMPEPFSVLSFKGYGDAEGTIDNVTVRRVGA